MVSPVSVLQLEAVAKFFEKLLKIVLVRVFCGDSAPLSTSGVNGYGQIEPLKAFYCSSFATFSFRHIHPARVIETRECTFIDVNNSAATSEHVKEKLSVDYSLGY